MVHFALLADMLNWIKSILYSCLWPTTLNNMSPSVHLYPSLCFCYSVPTWRILIQYQIRLCQLLELTQGPVCKCKCKFKSLFALYSDLRGKNAVKELLLNSTQQVRDLNGLQSHSTCETSLTKNHRHFVELRGSLKKQAEFMSKNFFQGMEKHCSDCLLAGCSSKEIHIDLNKGMWYMSKEVRGSHFCHFFSG